MDRFLKLFSCCDSDSVKINNYPSQNSTKDPQKQSIDNTTTIGIVGGGASGLCCAYYLLQKGYKASNITILESTGRLGGKINSIMINGQHCENGATHILDYYTTVFELLKAFDVESEPIKNYHIVLDETISELGHFIEHSLLFPVEINTYYKLTAQYYSQGFFKTSDFTGITSDPWLMDSTYNFLVQNGMNNLIPFMSMLCLSLCSTDIANTPLGMFLKVFPPTTLHKFLNYNIPILGPLISPSPASYIPKGYETLMVKLGQYLMDQGVSVKYHQNVMKVDSGNWSPVGENSKPLILTKDHKYTFHKIIMTSQWRSVDANFNPILIEGLPVNNLIQTTKMISPCAFKIHFTPQNNLITGDYLFLKSETNYPYAMYNFDSDSNVFGVIMNIDHNDVEILKQNIKKVIEPLVGPINFIPNNNGHFCPVQPIVDLSEVQKGYYNKLENYQGVGQIYYSNIYFTYNYSGLVMDYAKDMIQNFF